MVPGVAPPMVEASTVGERRGVVCVVQRMPSK
jgi:hypothetical protein